MTCPFFNFLQHVQAGLQNNYVLTLMNIRYLVFDTNDSLCIFVYNEKQANICKYQDFLVIYKYFEPSSYFTSKSASLFGIVCLHTYF